MALTKDDVKHAHKLVDRLFDLETAAERWERLGTEGNALGTRITQAINMERMRHNLPPLADDDEMNRALHTSIVCEYVRRICETSTELKKMGVAV